jgi:hypothetical protein
MAILLEAELFLVALSAASSATAKPHRPDVLCTPKPSMRSIGPLLGLRFDDREAQEDADD